MRSIVIAVLMALAGNVAANDSQWGCACLLCLADPRGPTTEQACQPPIFALWRHLAKGKPFPSCPDAKGVDAANRPASKDWCPAHLLDRVVRESTNDEEICRATGSLEVAVDGATWHRVWYGVDGYVENTYIETFPAAQAAVERTRRELMHLDSVLEESRRPPAATATRPGAANMTATPVRTVNGVPVATTASGNLSAPIFTTLNGRPVSIVYVLSPAPGQISGSNYGAPGVRRVGDAIITELDVDPNDCASVAPSMSIFGATNSPCDISVVRPPRN